MTRQAWGAPGPRAGPAARWRRGPAGRRWGGGRNGPPSVAPGHRDAVRRGL